MEMKEVIQKMDERKELMEKCKVVYRNYGYDYEHNFAGEYYFMFNTKTNEKVRLYYSGRVDEYK